MKRLKRQKHHNNTPQRNTTGGTRGWKKCPHCKFNTRSGHKLGQHIRRSHKEDLEAKEAKIIKEAIASTPLAPLASGKKRGRPKLHPSTMDSLEALIASVKERLMVVEHKLATFTLLQQEKAQLEHDLNILTLTGQRLREQGKLAS